MDRTGGVVIVTLETAKKVEDLKSTLSRMKGVRGVEFDTLTNKLVIHYESGVASAQQIKTAIREFSG